MKNQNGFSLLELMIALTLSAVVCIGIFHCMNAMQDLYRRQMAIASLQEKMRFISFYLRDKIQSAGDWSCEPDREKPRAIVIRRYDADEALDQLGLTIQPKTDLLQLQNCIRINEKKQYLPINFFIANTTRVNSENKLIPALFMKIDDHPREELITGMIDFQVRLYHTPKMNVNAVKIDYLLSSIDCVVTQKNTYWFNNKWVSASDYALYQPGILYATRR